MTYSKNKFAGRLLVLGEGLSSAWTLLYSF